MKLPTIVLSCVVTVFAAGCATETSLSGPKGPELVASGRSTESEQYAELGLEFTTWGDFVALASPGRWKSPVATGGSLSWINPAAWRDDAGRTGRILIGEAAVIGGVVAVAGSVDDDSNGPAGAGTTLPPPPATGGGSPPPAPFPTL